MSVRVCECVGFDSVSLCAQLCAYMHVRVTVRVHMRVTVLCVRTALCVPVSMCDRVRDNLWLCMRACVHVRG